MVAEFASNVAHNLFKPLLLFFFLGFAIPVLKVRFEFPKQIYQGLTLYLLVAIGWHGGEEFASLYLDRSDDHGGHPGRLRPTVRVATPSSPTSP